MSMHAWHAPELAWKKSLVWLNLRAELLVLGNELCTGFACAHAKAPVLDQRSLRGVDWQVPCWIQDALVPHCVRLHEPA